MTLGEASGSLEKHRVRRVRRVMRALYTSSEMSSGEIGLVNSKWEGCGCGRKLSGGMKKGRFGDGGVGGADESMADVRARSDDCSGGDVLLTPTR